MTGRVWTLTKCFSITLKTIMCALEIEALTVAKAQVPKLLVPEECVAEPGGPSRPTASLRRYSVSIWVIPHIGDSKWRFETRDEISVDPTNTNDGLLETYNCSPQSSLGCIWAGGRSSEADFSGHF